MRREQTNRIRFVIEDLIPAALRDSRLFHFIMRLAWGRHIERLADFRARAPFLSKEEYAALYRDHQRVHEGSDNSEACIERIVAETLGPTVCDVGCGTGELLRRLRQGRPELSRLTGIDFVVQDTLEIADTAYLSAAIEALPFPDRSFDTVLCTHTIEHILDHRRAIAELRRIARRRLIIVVPREREYLYTFNPHFHFFPYVHSFLRAMHPVPAQHLCIDIGRDIYYREDLA
ncbi:MAG TPA: class I SAM-dependent methyltransferase [Kiloniellales bacterium]|nr:class I SAM-dependent methyltransferase [Kiloniellales bacterium]